MKIRFKFLILMLIVTGAFLAGYWVNHEGGGSKPAEGRRILYYMDPMNPAYKSDKPGMSPSCGMPLEPVYADQGNSVAGGSDSRASMPPGTIRVSLEKQQLIGVKVMTVEKAPWSHTTRVLGRVTPDETLVHRINAAVNGWIEDALPVTTGSMVEANEMLATFYSLEYRNLFQNYFNLININKDGSPGAKAVSGSSQLSVGQLKQLRDAARDIGQAGESAQLEYYRKNLYNFGMSAHQMEEMERTRTIPNVVEIRAPIAGFILYRNVFPGLRFDRGTEFFRIADLSRVWILADVFENEASYFKPGMRVKMELPYQKKILYARISNVLPQFDPVSRTLKVRLVADNPGYAMRPDMFVNVELPASGPPAIIVPIGAVLDSGLKKTVFVDRGNGFFEPRQVETGRVLGERVEIARGLMPGEKIVVSGNFLLDSEARLQQAASVITGKIGRDPVCGMNIDEDRARSEGNAREYRGKTYFFCTPACRDDFGKEPERYVKSASARGSIPMPGSPDAATEHASHGPATVPKPRGAKTAHEAHEGMTMPVVQTPHAMPGKQAASPKTESKTEGMAISAAAAPGTGPQLPGQGDMPMTMPQGAAPMVSGPQAGAAVPGPKTGEMFPPATGAPEMNRQPRPFPGPAPGDKPLPGSPGNAPIPGSVAGSMIAPPTVAPGMNRGPQAFPGPGGAPMSGPQSGGMAPPSAVPGKGPGSPALPGQRGVPGPMPQKAAPMSGAQTGEITPQEPVQAPVTRTPRINPRLQRYGLPGTVPQAGPQQEAAPMSGVQTEEIAPQEPVQAPVTRTPRINPRLQRYRPPGTVPQAGPQEAVPMPGTKAGETPPPATDTPR